MQSHITANFRNLFRNLPRNIQTQARKSYQLWRDNHFHKSLHFKPLQLKQGIYSVRIGMQYRALGMLEDDEIYWFWIGSHAEYNNLLKRLA